MRVGRVKTVIEPYVATYGGSRFPLDLRSFEQLAEAYRTGAVYPLVCDVELLGELYGYKDASNAYSMQVDLQGGMRVIDEAAIVTEEDYERLRSIMGKNDGRVWRSWENEK